MKLQNRKTGEIVELLARPSFVKRDKENYLASEVICFDSLAELNEEWQDYEEEEKEYYTLNSSGQIWTTECFNEESIKDMKSIGNYFDTREEAELAVRKLKAWKRLKDEGFEFDGIRSEGSNCLIKTKLKDNTGVTFDHAQQFYEDVDLLFHRRTTNGKA